MNGSKPNYREFRLPVGDEKAEVLSGKWREQARCREIGYPFTIFYSSNNEETNIAKAICSMCPVVKACLDYAIMTKEPDGVWGGLDYKQRKKLIKSLS